MSAPVGRNPGWWTGWDDDEGVSAAEAWSQEPQPLPVVPPPPRTHGRSTAFAAGPPGESGLRAESIRALAEDAAARALALASGDTESGLDLTLEQDVARWAAVLLEGPGGDPYGGSSLTDLARRTAMSPRELWRRSLAWRDGGAGGFAALVDSWDPHPAELAPGLQSLGPSTIVRRNRLTHGDEQLRLGRDGRWYPFRKTRHGWDPNGPPFEESELGDRPPVSD